MTLILSTNITGQECIYDNCGGCRACGENPNRVAAGCGKGNGFYTTYPERIARYKKENPDIVVEKYIQCVQSWNDWGLGPLNEGYFKEE